MEVIYKRCCGLDVHKEIVVACLLIREGGKVVKEIRTFLTMTVDLVVLHDWLKAHEVTHVAMESTGIYWRPVFNLLEGDFTVLLVNAAHIKNVPGRKTDMKDCEWIADLLSHGLLRGSTDPQVLSELAKGRLRKKLPEMKKALEGRFRSHHRFMVAEILTHLDFLDEAIERVSQEVSSRIVPFLPKVKLMDLIPGIDQRVAEGVLAEIGVEMSCFPT